jgi:dTDP-4-dehydrorhamnose reductase
MAKRLLITGAGGFVAGSVIRQAPGAWEVHAVSRSAAPVERPGLVWHTLDPIEEGPFETLFHELRPRVVVHTAAMADIDACEARPDLARRVNTDLTRRIAVLCRDAGARLVHLSTDNVFDGEKGDYTEEDPPDPVNFYGDTKVEAERAVVDSGAAAVVARVAVVLGLPLLGVGNSFLTRMMESWKAGRPVGVPADEVRTPIDVVTLGRAILELADSQVTGILHLAGSEKMNRHEMAHRIAERLGFPREYAVPNDPTKIPGRAPRPRDVSLVNRKARGLLTTPLPNLMEGLELVLEAADRR